MADESLWKERLALLLSRGGVKASVLWAVKKLLKVEVHFIYALALPATSGIASPSRCKNPFRSVFLHTANDVAALTPELLDQLEDQSGSSVSRLVESGSSVYAFVDGTSVVSQLNVCWKPLLRVDSPTDLEISLKPADGFLGYLFTYPGYRGAGAASTLIAMVHGDAASRGCRRLVTHIRSTNSPSLNTFEKSGWKRVGWIVTRTPRRLLTVRLSREAGIGVSRATR